MIKLRKMVFLKGSSVYCLLCPIPVSLAAFQTKAHLLIVSLYVVVVRLCRLQGQAPTTTFATFTHVALLPAAELRRMSLEINGDTGFGYLAVPKGGILFTGGESRSITAWDTNSGKVAYSIEDAHSTRVKGIVVLTKDGNDDEPYLVASASSDGLIRVWDVRMATKGKPNPLAEANTKSRLTCLAGSSLKSFKRPQIGKTAPKEEEDVAEEV